MLDGLFHLNLLLDNLNFPRSLTVCLVSSRSRFSGTSRFCSVIIPCLPQCLPTYSSSMLLQRLFVFSFEVHWMFRLSSSLTVIHSHSFAAAAGSARLHCLLPSALLSLHLRVHLPLELVSLSSTAIVKFVQFSAASAFTEPFRSSPNSRRVLVLRFLSASTKTPGHRVPKVSHVLAFSPYPSPPRRS